MNKKKKITAKKIFYYCIGISAVIHIAAIAYINKHLLSFSFKDTFKVAGLSSNSDDKKSQNICRNNEKLTEEDILMFSVDKKGSRDNLLEPGSNNFVPQKEVCEEKEELSITSKEMPFANSFDYEISINSKPVVKKLKLKKKDLCQRESFPKKDNSEQILSYFKKVAYSEDIKAQERVLVDSSIKGCSKERVRVKKVYSPLLLEKDFFVGDQKQIIKEVAFTEKPLINIENIKSTLWEKAYKIKSSPFLSFVPLIPSLEELSTVSCGDDFYVDVEYIPNDEEAGYIYALTIMPKEKRDFEKVKQNYYFVIDKSNSIDKRRLTTTRNAIISSLSQINKNDRFNILVFDNKLTMLFDRNQNPSRETVKYARDFLRAQKTGTFFSSKSLALPLNKLLQNKIVENEINNIIFLTDGEGIEQEKKYSMLQKWSKLNGKNQNLNIISISSDKNNNMLDLFSSVNGGKHYIAHTIKGIRRQVVKLVKELKYPIAKNISINIYDKENSGAVIEPSLSPSHDLYYDQPLVVIGKAKELKDFTIFIQGRNAEKWFNIKKDVSFTQAKKGGRSLEEKWALHRASRHYVEYLEDKNIVHLDLAEKILEPLDIPTAFR